MEAQGPGYIPALLDLLTPDRGELRIGIVANPHILKSFHPEMLWPHVGTMAIASGGPPTI
jgi:hypothetical protein